MKYIIMPILQFLVAVLFSLIYIIYFIIVYPLNSIWNFTLEYDFEHTVYYDSLTISPYWNKNPNASGRIYFKSLLHYIWGIE